MIILNVDLTLRGPLTTRHTIRPKTFMKSNSYFKGHLISKCQSFCSLQFFQKTNECPIVFQRFNELRTLYASNLITERKIPREQLTGHVTKLLFYSDSRLETLYFSIACIHSQLTSKGQLNSE